MIEIIYNKWFWAIILGIGLIILQRFFLKDKSTQLLENDYDNIINSEKYKVKGQYD